MYKNVLFFVALSCTVLSVDNVRLNHNNKHLFRRQTEKKTEPIEPASDNNAIPHPLANTEAKITDINTNNTAQPIVKNTESTTPTQTVVFENDLSSQTSLTVTFDAVKRGFYVFMGLGALVMIYMGVRTFRSNKPPPADATIRKYGVTAKRGDLEMLPLPLAEDEDDDTVFDVGNHFRPNNL